MTEEANDKFPLFLIDHTVLLQMLEGDNKNRAIEMLDRITNMKKRNVPFKAITTLPCFLRAIWEAKNLQVENLRKIIDPIQIISTGQVDYKSEKEVTEDIIKLAEKLTKDK